MKQVKKSFVGVIFTLCLLMLGSMSVFAATYIRPTINEVTATAVDKYSFTVSWSGSNVEYYELVLTHGRNVVASIEHLDPSVTSTSYTFDALNAGITHNTPYTLKVTAYNSTGNPTSKEVSVKTLDDTPAVTGAAVANAAADSITLELTGTNVVTYNVYLYDYATSTDVLVAQLPAASGQVAIPNLAQGTKYKYKVTGTNAIGEVSGYNGTISGEARTLVTAVTGLKLDRFWHYIEKVDISWDSLSGVDEYEYILLDSKGKTVETKTLTYPSVSTNVKANHIYTAKVRAIQKDAAGAVTAYSDYSEILVYEQPWMKSAKVISTKNEKTGKTTNKLSIKWTKQTGATGYEVYVSTDKSSGYKKVKSVGKNKTSITLTKFKNKKIKKKQDYYVYIVSKTKFKGETCRSGLVYVWKTGTGSNETYY